MRRIGDLMADSQCAVLEAAVVIPDQNLQCVADLVVALGHHPQPLNLGAATLILIPQQRVEESATISNMNEP